jgi:hypothetical protein
MTGERGKRWDAAVATIATECLRFTSKKKSTTVGACVMPLGLSPLCSQHAFMEEHPPWTHGVVCRECVYMGSILGEGGGGTNIVVGRGGLFDSPSFLGTSLSITV